MKGENYEQGTTLSARAVNPPSAASSTRKDEFVHCGRAYRWPTGLFDVAENAGNPLMHFNDAFSGTTRSWTKSRSFVRKRQPSGQKEEAHQNQPTAAAHEFALQNWGWQ
jgi:hypothetical protein